MGGRIVCASRHPPRPTVGSEGEWLKAAKQQSSKAASSKAGKQSIKAAKQQSSKPAKQQSCRAGEQQSRKAPTNNTNTNPPNEPQTIKATAANHEKTCEEPNRYQKTSKNKREQEE